MFISGLVSVTFRQLNVEQIVDVVRRSRLDAIEWGGDVHVPHGDLECAEKVRQLTVDAGLCVASYGSYYRVGHNEPVDFARVLDTALALGAPIIRVWAGKQGSESSDEDYWAAVIKDSQRIARLAAAQKIVVSYEYHAKTLTDTCAGTLRLLQSVNEPNLLTHWQPVNHRSREQNLEELAQLRAYLCHIHAFHWLSGQRRPLAEGEDDWRCYLKSAWETRRDHGVLLEFVADDEPDNYLTDAGSLRNLLKTFQPS